MIMIIIGIIILIINIITIIMAIKIDILDKNDSCQTIISQKNILQTAISIIRYLRFSKIYHFRNHSNYN